MNLRFIDWIWQIRGTIPLAPEQTADQALTQLEPLFHKPGTTHERTAETLKFRKTNQAAQDKMSIFDGGVLRIDHSASGPVLRYALTSRALLFCCLAPLLFLAMAQLTIAIGSYEKPTAEAEAKTKKPDKDTVVPLNPIDKFLGAPAPEDPKKDPKKKPDKNGKKPSPTPAYVFAGIFAALYVVGRILEDHLIKSLFKKCLLGELRPV